MTPFRPAGRSIFRVKVPNRNGAWKDCSTETRDAPTARAFQRMIDALGRKGKRDWEALEAVFYGRRTLGALFDAYRDNALDRFRAELADVDLAQHIDGWQAWLADRVTGESRIRYLLHVQTFFPMRRSQFTPASVEVWLTTRRGKAATKRRYFAALGSFVTYLRALGILDVSPLDRVSPPRAPNPDPSYLELDEVMRLVQSTEEPHQTLFAFLYGTGCDLSPALALSRRDVDLASHEVRAHGTKSHRRDRLIWVADWAMPWLERLCRGLHPDAPLFPGISRWTASDVHRERTEALGMRRKGIRLHAARHHWAVRMVRAGTPIEIVARQLGNGPQVCQRYYARFVPTSEERKWWEQQATKRDTRGGI